MGNPAMLINLFSYRNLKVVLLLPLVFLSGCSQFQPGGATGAVSAQALTSSLAGSGGYIPAYNTTGGFSNSVIYSNGSVGIGTTSPGLKLDTYGMAGYPQLAGTSQTNGVARFETNLSIALDLGSAGASPWGFWLQASNNQNAGYSPLLLNPNGGNVGIGMASPAYTLDVNGAARVTQLVYSSDQRLKERIEPISSALDKIQSLKGVNYFWNALAHKKGHQDSDRQLGLIAQDVEKVFPEAVLTGSDGYKSVNYPVLVAPLVEAVKTLKSENEILKAQNEDFKKRLEKLESRLQNH